MNYIPEQPLEMTDLDLPPSQGALPVWIKVFTKPSVQTFVEITRHPEAKAKAAYLWIFLAGTLSGFINAIMRLMITSTILQQAGPDFGQVPGLEAGFRVGGIFGVISGAPIAGLFSVIGFAIGVAIVQATARFFGGQGSFDKLAYAFGAITVPFTLVSALMAPLSLIPLASVGTLPVLVLLGLYVLYLEVTAIKAIHQCGWGEAVATLFLPTLLVVMLCGVAFFGLIKFVGPSLNDILRQMPRFQ